MENKRQEWDILDSVNTGVELQKPSTMITDANHKIKLFAANGKVFVWNANDIITLREKFRIVGSLVGCLPRSPRQNIHLGLPLQLAPYEVSLLLEKEVAELVETKKIPELADVEKIKEFQKMRDISYQDQISLFMNQRRAEINQHRFEITEGKKRKRKRLEEGERDREEEEEEFNVDDIHIPPIKREQTIVQLFTENPWKLEEDFKSKEWLYPQTEKEKLLYTVFKDLWEKQYYLTPGTKFGGDFLVYPGDPALFHSHFIAVCLPTNEKLSGLEVVTLGRLGATVRKTVALCSVRPDGAVSYTSLQWTGIT